MMHDEALHHIFMKRVVDLASEIGAIGHLARMGGVPVEIEDFYVCATYAADGPHNKIRIDVIAADALKKFTDTSFVKNIRHRPDESSHADLAAIFAICAEQVFLGKVGERQLVRRVSIPIVA